MLTDREKKTLQAGVPYILFYTVLFHLVCVLIDNAVFASLLSLPYKPRAMATARVVVVWVSAMSRRYTSSHIIPVQLPLLLFSHSFCVKCTKNRYPLINSKAVKILSSPKGCVSS